MMIFEASEVKAPQSRSGATKSGLGRMAAVTLAAAVLATSLLAATPEANAGYRRHFNGGAVAAGVIGGLALGALAAGAARQNYNYGGPVYAAPPPVYAPQYAPVYTPQYAPAYAPQYAPAYSDDGDCYFQKRRFWNGYEYEVRRVRVCE